MGEKVHQTSPKVQFEPKIYKPQTDPLRQSDEEVNRETIVQQKIFQ